MLEPGTSDIGTAVGSYSVIHISQDRVQLSHIFCISERRSEEDRDSFWVTVPVTQKLGLSAV